MAAQTRYGFERAVFRQLIHLFQREAFRKGLIEDGETWLRMLEDRNRTPHTYDEETAMDIYERIHTDYIPLFDRLLAKMKQRLDSAT